MIHTWLTKTLGIKHPIIMAPMFLVSNEKMLIEAHKVGITGCIPSLNFKEDADFELALERLKNACQGNFGINLIVNKSNTKLKAHMASMEKHPPAYIITSLGSPEETIKRFSSMGVKIICDVVDEEYAKKVEQLGADALIAVNSGAGGHAGPLASSILVPKLKKATKLPVISAGGVGSGAGLLSQIALGAEGASIGSPFISTIESPVNHDYKKAILDYGAEDIVLTDKISGTPCTVINTPYLKKIGTKQNYVESLLNKNKKIKKYAKMLTYYKGMKALEKAAFGATYKTLWCAGPSIEFVNAEKSVKETVEALMNEFELAYLDLKNRMQL